MKVSMACFCAVLLVSFGLSFCRTAIAADGDKGCIVVTGLDSNGKDLTDSDVYLEQDDGRGGWKKPDGTTKKHVGKSDKGEAKICGLKSGTKYRVIARKDSDDNEGNWQVFVFQPDQKTKQMSVVVSIKMKAKRTPNNQPGPSTRPAVSGKSATGTGHPFENYAGGVAPR
jgi:hypothetical protein